MGRFIECAMTIGGKSVMTEDSVPVINPSTGDVIGRAPAATQAHLEAAVTAATQAFPSWSHLPESERSAACLRIADTVAAHAEELATLITLEQGKPLNGVGSRFEIGGVQAWARYTAGLSMPPKTIQDDEKGRITLFRRPIGVVGSITPWNWPAVIASWHFLPALLAGNTVVLKPSPFTPLATLRMIERLNTVLPPGVLNVVSGDDGIFNVGAAMARHPGIGKIVFTGSCATGAKVMMSAAETMKRLTLELGGNDAAIVLPDVDPQAIAEGLFWGAFINNGQTCAALKRLYVHDDIHDAVCDALVAYTAKIPVGDGLDESSILGPIANRPQFEKVSALVADAKTRGRVLLGGSSRNALFFDPTIIADLDDDAPLVREEQFGPALPILRFSRLEDAIARANASDNGLGGSVWTNDIDHARQIAARLECGSVWINQHGMVNPIAPFGGVKRSGLGVEFGAEGLAECTNIQVVHG